jgi:hypothetical protein
MHDPKNFREVHREKPVTLGTGFCYPLTQLDLFTGTLR